MWLRDAENGTPLKVVTSSRALRKERTLAGERYRKEANLATSWVCCELWTSKPCKSRGFEQLGETGSPDLLGLGETRELGTDPQEAHRSRQLGRDTEEGDGRGRGVERMEKSLARPLHWACGSLSLHFLALKFSHEPLSPCWSHHLAPGTSSPAG